MTAPSAEQIIAAIEQPQEAHELAQKLERVWPILKRALLKADTAHREGWQAAIEAAKPVAREIALFAKAAGEKRGHSVVYRDARMSFGDWAEAKLAALPYQLPEDRGDG